MRILLLNKNHIGDAVFTTPAIAALRRAHPKAFLVNATVPGVAELFAASPHITEHSTITRFRLGTYAALVGRMRRFRFDAVVITAASSTRSGLLARLSGAPMRIGFDHPATRHLLTHRVPEGDGRQHQADDYLDEARLLGPVEGPFPLEVHPLPQWREEWERARDRLGLPASRPLVGLNPGSSVAAKQWPVERWAALADALSSEGYAPLLLGGPGDGALVEAIRSQSRTPAPSVQGQLRLGGLAEAARACAAFVGGDTGPLHLAVAVGTPVVALYGPTDPRRTGPYTPTGAPAIVLRSSEEGEAAHPMASIRVADVAAAVSEAIRLPRSGV